MCVNFRVTAQWPQWEVQDPSSHTPSGSALPAPAPVTIAMCVPRCTSTTFYITPDSRPSPMGWGYIALSSCAAFFKIPPQSKSHFRSLAPLRHPRILRRNIPRSRRRSYLWLRPEALPTKSRLPPVRSPFCESWKRAGRSRRGKH